MKRTIPFLMCAMVLGVTALSARAEHYEVFLLAGQSNMDGRGAKKDLAGDLAQWARPQKDVLIRFAAGGLKRPYTESNGFEALEPGYSGTPGKKAGALPTGTFGPEVSLGRALADGLPGKHVLLIKYAEGGTSLKEDWNPAAKDKLFEKFVAFVNKALKELKDRGDTYEIRGMVWHQGESDAGQPAEKYQEMLTSFIAEVRSMLGLKDMPFVIGEVYDNGKRDRVRAAQKAVAKDVKAAFFVSAEGLKTFDNGTHFDAASQIEFGKRMAQPLLKLLSSKK